MSERDKQTWQAIKADPVRYAAYLERKRRERAQRRCYETQRKRNWRAANPDHAKRLRDASRAVSEALASGKLIRPSVCAACGEVDEVEAHHHHGYAKEHWLDIVWLCVFCHRKADKRISALIAET